MAVPKRNIYTELNFELKKDGRKYSALCLFCKKTVSNVATQRLKAHRNICDYKNKDHKEACVIEDYVIDENDPLNLNVYDEISIEPVSEIVGLETETETAVEAVSFLKPTSSYSKMDISSSSQSQEIENEYESDERSQSTFLPLTTSSTDLRFKKPFRHTNRQKGSVLKNFMDSISKNEEDEINKLVARFFYGCNIPFNVIDSGPFQDLIKKLRPASVKLIPSRKTLSTTLLDNEYQRQIEKGKSLIGLESVLL